MSRPRYTTTSQDKAFAAAYLERCLWEPGFLNHLEAAEAVRAAKALPHARRKTADLNAWAERVLDTSRWDHLKTALRQQRRRARSPDRKTLTITNEALRAAKYCRNASTRPRMSERRSRSAGMVTDTDSR
jgi:hypothetical protein